MVLTNKQIKKQVETEKVTVKQLKDFLKSKKLTGIDKYNKNGLLILYTLYLNSVKNLKKLAKEYKLKGYSKLRKGELTKFILPIQIKKVEELEKYKKKLRKHRNINKKYKVITQESVVNNIGKMPDSQIIVNKDIKYFDDNYKIFLEIAQKEIYKNKNVLSGSIQLQYLISDMENSEDRIKYTKPAVLFNKDTDINNIKLKAKTPASENVIWVIGYKIKLITKDDEEFTKENIEDFKAYHPSSDRKYHELTTSSTSLNGLCIYETFLDIINKLKLKYSRRLDKRFSDKIKTMLKEEGSEIERLVKEGYLIKALKLLTKKYNNKVLIVFYESGIYYNDKKEIKIEGHDKPILIDNGDVKTIFNKELIDYIGKKCILYEKNTHVAPFIFNINSLDKTEEKAISEYRLKGNKLRTKPKQIKNILGYDVETYKDDNDNSHVYCICLNGHVNNIEIKKTFYGKSSVKKFINYLDYIKTPINCKRTKPNKKVDDIFIYGFNNSRFDNIFIYEELKNRDPKTKFIFANNDIKKIKYNNITFFDISLYYSTGSLRNTCKQFNLESKKGYYPYDFASLETLEYIGKVPDKKYWVKEGHYNKYVKEYGIDFNMKHYTTVYCMLDSYLVYELAKIHLNECTDKINNRYFNCSKSPTSANLSLKLFKQVFLDGVLYQSPDSIIENERNAYKGGRTEVFKKVFNKKDGKLLNYVDINSAHPSGMTLKQPHKYINTMPLDNTKPYEYEAIIDYHLYLCKGIYVGNDKYFIPNILQRHKKGDIIATKNWEYSWHWGCEIKEAILNKCDVYCKKVNIYEGKYTFKEFAEYFYNERTKVKKTNIAKAQFFKSVLNSLYGKFGQKPLNKTALIKSDSEFNKLINNDMTLLVDFKIINNMMLIEYKDPKTEYESIGKLVRFSSYIASTTRCKLSEMMRDVGHENVYYCDTDSIFTTKKPSEKFLDQSTLGKWSYECGPIKKAVFLAPKSYYYKEVKEDVRCDKCKNKSKCEKCQGISKKCKGIRTKHIKINDYDNLVSGKIETFESTNQMFFRSLENIKIKKDQIRTISVVYNKRKWINNNSLPFDNLNEWDEQ